MVEMNLLNLLSKKWDTLYMTAIYGNTANENANNDKALKNFNLF